MKIQVLLRRIALGLPLTAIPLAGGVILASTACTCVGDCGEPLVITRELTTEQRAMLSSGGTGTSAVCFSLCEGPPTTGDGATADAGMVPSSGRGWTCSASGMTLTCSGSFSCGGRAPQGLLPSSDCAGEDVGSFFARMAHLERAAVPAFDELANELRLHGAPGRLVRGARRSARQEVRHARLIGGLAHAYGASVPSVERTETAPRSLVEMARDNAFEGCVREAFGALLAAHQSAHAADPTVRATFGEIARDEARHALLSFELLAWSRDRASRSQRRAIDHGRAEGLASLLAETASAPEPSDALRVFAGLPSATAAHDLMTALAA